MDRVDQRRRKWLLIGIRPLRLRNNLLDVFAQEEEVILNILLTNDSGSVNNLASLRSVRLGSLSFSIFSCCSSLITSA